MNRTTLKNLLVRAALAAALASLVIQPAGAHGSGGGKGGSNHSGSPSKPPITITHGGNPPRGSAPRKMIDVRDHRRNAGTVRDHRRNIGIVRDHRRLTTRIVRDHRKTVTVVRDHREPRNPPPAAAPPR